MEMAFKDKLRELISDEAEHLLPSEEIDQARDALLSTYERSVTQLVEERNKVMNAK